jgi:hypothetical protein
MVQGLKTVEFAAAQVWYPVEFEGLSYGHLEDL